MASTHDIDGAAAHHLKPWALVIAFVAVALVGAELVLRSNVLWRLPLGYLLQDENDRYTRATWLAHRSPASGADEIIVLGSSTAAAVAELPDGESQQILRAGISEPGLELVSLAVPGGCYPEHFTLLEKAIEAGHQPRAVVLFSWPHCLGRYDDTDVLLARRMPLVSSSLVNLEPPRDLMELRIQARLVRASAVQRYRYAINAWLRERWRGVLRGRAPWAPVTFEVWRRVTAWKGDWTLDREHYERLTTLPERWSPTGPAAHQLAALLDLAKRNAVPVLIVESPWSPPLHDVFHSEADSYSHAMQSIATRGGATYVDPNRPARLSPDLFYDIVHVNHEGARAYLPVVASELRRLAQDR